MDFCENCGKEVPEHLKFCPYCNAYIEKPEGSTFWYGILSFFVPIIGIILYLVWRKEKPKAAKSAIKGWLLNVILKIIVLIIAFVFSTFIIVAENENKAVQNDTTHKSALGINDYDYDFGTYYGEDDELDEYDFSAYYTTENTTYGYNDYYDITEATEGFDYNSDYDYSYDSLLAEDAFDNYDDNYFSDYFGYDY